MLHALCLVERLNTFILIPDANLTLELADDDDDDEDDDDEGYCLPALQLLGKR